MNSQEIDIAEEKNSAGRYKTEWRRLLSRRRICKELDPRPEDEADRAVPVDDRSPFERDYERVLFSPAFRRLAGKTQVRTFPDVDYIHNRLTHSMEVSSVARTLGSEIASFLMSCGDSQRHCSDSICWICQAAGLAHDIGNPPYGHAGEYAIQYWASKLKDGDRIFACDSVWKDIESYDGNAQSFRECCVHMNLEWKKHLASLRQQLVHWLNILMLLMDSRQRAILKSLMCFTVQCLCLKRYGMSWGCLCKPSRDTLFLI